MGVETRFLSVKTKGDLDIIDITKMVTGELKKSKIASGIVAIFCPGSTASISTIEFEPNLVKDFSEAVERIIPSDIMYRHRETWGDNNGKSHVRATLMGPGITVPFNERRLLLGKWQQIALLDFDVPPRERKIVLQIVGE